MATESAISSAVPRYQLGQHLRELREAAGLSVRQAGQRMEMSASTVSRVENGETPVRSVDVEQACKIYGVTDEELIHALVELAKETRQAKAKYWLSSYTDVVADNFVLYIGLEASTSALSWYETDLVPGLLQTREYAHSIMTLEHLTGKQIVTEQLERRLETRLRRQLILDRETDAPALSVVLGEAVLRRRIGGVETMAGQLDHLLELAKRPSIDIRVMPLDREHAGLVTGPFILLDFPPRGPLVERPGVYVDGHLGFFYADKTEEVEMYRTTWASVWDTALSSRDSVDFIDQRLKDHRS
jgi:transcriptional regulator with XRE-family HTH domain